MGRPQSFHHALALLVLAPLVTACTFGDVDGAMRDLVGRQIGEAVSRLGEPAEQTRRGDETIYVWTAHRTGSYAIPSTQYLGSKGALIPSGSFQTITYDHRCTLEIVAGPDALIRTWRAEGDSSGCDSFAARLAD